MRLNTRRKLRRSHKKTRKQRTGMSGGGRLSLVPFLHTPAPGAAVPTGPDILAMIGDMLASWDFYMISAHGTLKPSTYLPVPANTYLVFNAPSGCMAIGTLVPHFMEVTAPDKIEFVTKLASSHLASIDYMHKMETGQAVPKVPDSLLRTLSPSERRELAKCLAPAGAAAAGAATAGAPVPGSNLKTLYPKKYNELNVRARHTWDPCLKDNLYTAKTIYGPGERYPNLELAFYNTNLTRLIMGVYELPIPEDEFLKLNAAHNKLKEEWEVTRKSLGLQSTAAKNRAVEKMEDITEKADIKDFGPGTPNQRPDLIRKKTTLEDVLRAMPALPAGKNRFIFITACRGVKYIAPEHAPQATRVARLARAVSIANNNALLPALEAESIREATNYYSKTEGRALGGNEAGAGGNAVMAGKLALAISSPDIVAKLALRERAAWVEANPGKSLPLGLRRKVGTALQEAAAKTGEKPGVIEPRLLAEIATEDAGAVAGAAAPAPAAVAGAATGAAAAPGSGAL